MYFLFFIYPVKSKYNESICDDILHAAVVLTKVKNFNWQILNSSLPFYPQDACVTRHTVLEHVKNNLSAHMAITGDIIFLDAIPHNPIGKKLRRTLKIKHENKAYK